MKSKIILLAIFFRFFLNAQEPNPNLYRTWYLVEILESDASYPEMMVEDINPSITPTITIAENLSFTGVGACNTFNGNFYYTSNVAMEDVMQTIDFSSTDTNCQNEDWENLEAQYFSFLNTYEFEGDYIGFNITENGENLQLYLWNTIFGYARFQSNPLSVEDLKKEKKSIEISPNPTHDFININSTSKIEKVEIYSTEGSLRQSHGGNTQSISIKNLPKGIYLLNVYGKNGVLTSSKIVKL